MIIVGLTGGIGMGKTTIAKMFKQLGAAVFSADAAVHQLYDKGGRAVPLIKAVFPSAIKNGRVDRKKLMQFLQADPLNFTVLESFIHPMVAELRAQEINKAKQKGKRIFIADIPLLFETGSEKQFDKIIVVSAPKKTQRERVLAREGMSEDKFASIISRQMPDTEKRARADFIIDTSKNLEQTNKQVKSIFKKLLED